MKWLITKISLFLARLLSYLPTAILLVFADILGFFFLHIFSYRKSVIDINLMHAFPHKKSEELWFIRSKFYRHLADIIMETIKSITISKNELAQRIQLHHNSYELLKKYEQSGRSIFIVLGHFGNWEWASLLAGLETKLPTYAIFAPPKNTVFNQFILKNRTRFGCQLIANNQIKTLYSKIQKEPALVAFVADQTPVDTTKAYWTKFLNINTPFYNGFETLAIKNDAIVVYASIQKINRGIYELHFNTITEFSAQTDKNYITEQYVRALEKDILQYPEYWIWSHRRWKRAGINY